MGKRILVVDDEEIIRSFLNALFTGAGYSVSLARDGEEALAILKRQNIQVMFLDLKMPGMTGIALCEEIRKERPIACVFAMTGYHSLFELADIRAAGFDDYFVKPVSIAVFLKAAGDAFEKLQRWVPEKKNASDD